MSQTTFHVDEVPIDSAKVQVILAILAKLLRVGKGLAALTPTHLDDEVIDMLQRVLDLAMPIASEPWFADLVNVVVSLVKSGAKPKDILAAIQAMLAK